MLDLVYILVKKSQIKRFADANQKFAKFKLLDITDYFSYDIRLLRSVGLFRWISDTGLLR